MNEGEVCTAAATRNQAHLSMIAALFGNFVQYKKNTEMNIWPKQIVFVVSSFVAGFHKD